ncbi:MAG: cobalamin-binding protein [Burkholderiales bacterium]
MKAPFSHLGGRFTLFALAACIAVSGTALGAGVTIKDDSGQSVHLRAPAQRMVTLSPHLTELVFAAGAGERVIAAVEFSDYPAAARALPRVGDSARLDVERIARMRPDLLLAWPHGAAERSLSALRGLGIPVFLSNPRSLKDIAATLEAIGRLAGSEQQANAVAHAFRQRLASLPTPAPGARPLRTLVQIWDKPLMTVNEGHLVSDALRACGGTNVFGHLRTVAPVVTLEAILAADPEFIVALPPADEGAWIAAWRRWPHVTAVRRGAMLTIPSDLLTRPTPRVLDGMERLCAAISAARA